MQFTFLQPLGPYILSGLRILTALTFFTHGAQKLWAWPTAFPYPLNGMTTTAAWLEVIGGALLAIGLFSRPVAFILAGLMAVAYFMAHAPQGFFPIVNGGEAAMLFSWIFLLIAAYGPGPLSVDRALGKA